MSGIVGSRLNIRGSGVVGKLGTDGQVLTSSGAGESAVFESAGGGAVSAINNATANELVTIGSTTTELDSETNLTYNGTILGAGATGASADLGVGIHIRTADSSASASAYADELVIENSDNSGISLLSGTSGEGNLRFGDSGNNSIGKVMYAHSSDSMQFTTNASEQMRLTSAGCLGIGTTGDSSKLKVETTTDSEKTVHLRHGDADNPVGLEIQYYGGSPNGSSDYFFKCEDSANPRFQVTSDGDVQNDDNAYGSISDERIKQDITDASSQWDDIKALRVRRFRKKEDVRAKGEEAHYEIGLIAQEAELISPKLIKESDPGMADIISDASFGTIVDDTSNQKFYLPKDTLPEGKAVGDPVLDESGNPTYYKKVGTVNSPIKVMKYSILYMKAIKALQESMERIEQLEAKVTALENS